MTVMSWDEWIESRQSLPIDVVAQHDVEHCELVGCMRKTFSLTRCEQHAGIPYNPEHCKVN